MSVIIPTHNPNLTRLEKTLCHLRTQSLPLAEWELVMVDNASENAKELSKLDCSWHPSFTLCYEQKLGLTHARIAGFHAASGEILVYVDDDNLLKQDYLKEARGIMNSRPELGAAGGKSLPLFEEQPASWVRNFDACLALRDLGDEELLSPRMQKLDAYPECAPIGAGMVVRRPAFAEYVSALGEGYEPLLDRQGENLSSGGDNDIVLHILRSGWQVGYHPKLVLEHIIPPNRTTRSYLAKLNYAMSRSWIAVLHQHGILPWTPLKPASVPLRKLKAFWQYRAFLGSTQFIRWRGACGMFEALSEI